MKKHMSDLIKMDRKSLEKKRMDLLVEIAQTRRGVVGGEIQNSQLTKLKRKTLARVNTILNTSSIMDGTESEKPIMPTNTKSSKTGRSK